MYVFLVYKAYFYILLSKFDIAQPKISSIVAYLLINRFKREAEGNETYPTISLDISQQFMENGNKDI